MGTLKFEVGHSLSQDEARKRVEALLSHWSRQYGMRAEWSGDSARISGQAMGVSIEASLSVLENKVGGEASDPGFLLRGQAQKYLTRKFAEYLDPSRPLEELCREA